MEEEQKKIVKPKPNRIYKILLIFFSILISVVIIANKDKLSELNKFGYLGIFLLSILGNSTVIVPAPVFLTALVGGSVFNPWVVGIVSAAGATIGELTGFMAGFGGKTFIEENSRYKRVRGWMQRSGFFTVFVLAAIPNPLFDIAGIIAGVTSYPIHKFLFATFLGKTIKFVAIALAGAWFF